MDLPAQEKVPKLLQTPHLHNFAEIFSRAKVNIALDLLTTAEMVNVAFGLDFYFCAKVAVNFEFFYIRPKC